MTSDRRTPVAIVGGGASGTILAAQLARRGIESVLIDGSGRLGRGVAYSTTEPAHLLNVPAELMSAWPGDADHFVRRAESEGVDRCGFAQRRLFGTYLGEILDQAIGSGKVEAMQAAATTASKNGPGWRVELDDGSYVWADALALAIGNQEPDGLRAFAGVGRRFIANPWGDAAGAAVRELGAGGGNALLIGTGLTMIDLVLSLNAAGYSGEILAVSRRGLVPKGHADYEPAPVDAERVPRGSLLDIWRWLRGRSGEVGWRAAIDSLRPHSHSLWQSFSGDAQKRFLRHARPWWDVHRHRIAPVVADAVARLIAEGRLRIMAGRIVDAIDGSDGLDVEVRRRGASVSQRMRFAYAFNCTGPLHSIERTRDPLLRSLLDAGETRPDHLGIGVEIDVNCRAGERLWALGPLTKGRYWEIIAVPDIREQAAEIARDIERELSR